jgi:hypothetical protein
VINSLTVYLNRYFYYFLEDPSHHFLYKHYVAKELAIALREKGHTELNIKDKQMRLRLNFYGITHNEEAPFLKRKECKNVTIRYSNIEVAAFCVTKRNMIRNN